MANSTNSLSHTKWLCKYHIVIVPKYRRKIIYNQYRKDLQEIIRTLCKYKGVEIIEGHMMPDHVHLLIEVDPQYGINRAVRHIKGSSSHALRSEFPSLKSRLPTLWTNSYFVSTVGGAPLEIIKQYIENQEVYKRSK